MEQTIATPITWNKAGIRQILSAATQNPTGSVGSVPYTRLVKKMLVRLYERQTADEQNADQTILHNKVGFNGRDANFLSNVARKSMAFPGLTPNQTVAVAKSLIKYAGQLEQIAKERVN